MFFGCRNIEEIIIHENITKIEVGVFGGGCHKLKKIKFTGTTNQWSNITKEDYWDAELYINTITCSNGTVTI